MQIIPNWHDAHALQLIDACLAKNSFPRDVVNQIAAALAAAEQHDHVATEHITGNCVVAGV
jgi:hypothetical protein